MAERLIPNLQLDREQQASTLAAVGQQTERGLYVAVAQMVHIRPAELDESTFRDFLDGLNKELPVVEGAYGCCGMHAIWLQESSLAQAGLVVAARNIIEPTNRVRDDIPWIDLAHRCAVWLVNDTLQSTGWQLSQPCRL